MTLTNKIAFYLIILSIPLILITSTIRVIANNIGTYEYCIEKYNVSKVTGIEDSELKRVYQQWIDYYNSHTDTAQITVKKDGKDLKLLSQKETIHMQDVKGLMRFDYYVQVFALIIFFGCAGFLWVRSKDRWYIVKGIFWGCLVTAGIMTILAVASMFFFEDMFLLFHYIGFSNQYWVLDPTKDYLIMLFPSGFFSDIATFGFIVVIIESLIIWGIAFGFYKWHSARIKQKTT